jgi:hypothetical protein
LASLKVLDAEPVGADAVEKLEDALTKAKAGELSSVAIAVVYRDGTSGRAWSAAPSLSCLIGAVARLQSALIEDAG